MFFEFSHPRRPVAGQDPARCCPDTLGVILAIPFERVELLERHLPGGPVHEKSIDEPVMSIHAYSRHPRRTSIGMLTVIFRWRVCVPRSGKPEAAVHKHGYVTRAFEVRVPPE